MDAAFDVHRQIGPGLMESVYEAVLARKLSNAGLQVQRQAPVKITIDGMTFDEGFKADLLINGMVIVELKSVEQLHRVHSKQLLTYLRLTGSRLGLLINFGEEYLKNGFKRIVNGLPE